MQIYTFMGSFAFVLIGIMHICYSSASHHSIQWNISKYVIVCLGKVCVQSLSLSDLSVEDMYLDAFVDILVY